MSNREERRQREHQIHASDNTHMLPFEPSAHFDNPLNNSFTIIYIYTQFVNVVACDVWNAEMRWFPLDRSWGDTFHVEYDVWTTALSRWASHMSFNLQR